MTMKKIVLSTYWSPNEVHNVLALLTELQAAIKANHADELEQYDRDIATEGQHDLFGFEDDLIPF